MRNAIANDSQSQHLPQPIDMDGVDLVALAQRESTPLHVYFASLIRERIAALKTALAGLDALVCFAVKANPDVAVLQLMAQRGEQQMRVDEIMKAYAGNVPGASVLVVSDGKPLVHKAYGLSNFEERVAATPATNYRLASVTKQFTAESILLLAQDGKLSIDDHVRKWLPSLPDTDDAITIRHLLTHTGGLIDYEDIMPADLSVALRDIDVLHLLERERRVYFAAGGDYRYSNGGYSMLALIVEKASGTTFQEFLRKRIFEPLGMHNTLAHVTEGPAVPHRAFGYALMAGKWESTDQSLTSAVLGDGGVYSSIDDLAKWDAALYDNRLLSEQSRRLAFTPWTRTDDPDIEYGFGWRITGETLWHSGESVGFRNVIVRYPHHHLTVIVLSNRDGPEPYRMALEIAQGFLK